MRGEKWNDKICNIDDASQVRSLTEQATVTCGRCGVKAHDPANVCDPVQFPDAGTLGD
ncbi:MAG: hypothetical protein NDI77_05200 [Geobacteraceae bacterium]|nr:hypothetical protein [Geobacteraceae bacterium]